MESKVIRNTLEYIKNILSFTDFSPINWPFEAGNISLVHDREKINMRFEAIDNGELYEAYKSRLPDLTISKNNVELIIPKGQAGFNCSIQLFAETQQMSMDIREIQTKDFDDARQSYIRVFQPIDRFNLFHDIHTFGYKEGNQMQLGLMEIDLNGFVIEVFPYNYDNRQYVAFEAKSPISATDFSNKIFSICVALGLITKTIWLDEAFVVEYADKSLDTPIGFRYHSLRPTIHGTYGIFSTNVYALEDGLRRSKNAQYASEILKDNKGDVKGHLIDWLQPDFISRLCSLLDGSDSLRNAAIMLIEGSSFPVEYQASMYCVALETITTHIKQACGINDQPLIPKAIFRKKLLAVFRKALECLSKEYPELKENIEIIKNKVPYLNSSTNIDKLTIPFEHTGYTLSPRDIESIKKRNLFLHGVIPNTSEIEADFETMLQTSLYLHKLCCILILKAAGFNSYILNNPVLFECKEACEAKEPPVISI